MRLATFDGAGPLVRLVDTGQVDPATGEPIFARADWSCNPNAGDGGPVKFAQFAGAVGANQTVVAAVSGKKIRVLQAIMAPSVTSTVSWSSSGGGVLTPVLNIVAALVGLLAGTNGWVCMPHSPCGWFETLAGEALRVTITGGTTPMVIGYQEV